MAATVRGRINVQQSEKAGTKRGDLLMYRPRRDANSVSTDDPDGSNVNAQTAESWVLIRCGGREFSVRESMAKIFLRRAQEVIASGGAELVPLLHAEGVELLLITPSTPYAITPSLVAPLVFGNGDQSS